MHYVLVMLESSRIPRAGPIKHSSYCFRQKVIRLHGILPTFEIKLAGKAVSVEVEVIDAPLDYNLLLGRGRTYAMSTIASVVFWVVLFPHEGNLVIVDQLNFIWKGCMESNEYIVPLVDQAKPVAESLSVGMYA